MSKFYENITESLWSDLQDRSSGDVVRKEDDVNHLDKDAFYDYIKSHYEFTEYETKFTCGYELIAIPLFTTPYSLRYTLLNVPEHRVEMYESLFEKWPTYLQTVLREKYNVESVENERGDIMTYITQKDKESDNKFLLDFIDTIINNVEKPVMRRITNESLWSDLQDRSSGDVVRKEEFTEEFIDKVKSDLIGFTMSVVYYIENYELTFDGFYKYLEEIENPDEVKKIIYYVKTHKDECDKLLEKDIEFENKLLDEKINVYLLRFVDNIVYDEKYHNTLSDIKKFASEIFKGYKSSYDFHINKRLIFKDKSVLFNEYIEDKWKDGSLKQKIDDLIKNENDEISKYGFVKEPGKTISETVNDWWYSLDDSKREELAWDEFGGDAEEEYYSDHNPKYNEYSGEDFDADEWWDNAYGIRRVKIYCSEHSKTNESLWSDLEDRSSGDVVRKEDERHKILERLLATYIKLFAESCYYHDEYTSGSYPDFRAYIKDFRDNPRIEEVCPDDSYFDDLLNYVNKETWNDQIDDTVMEMTNRLDKGEHLITDDVIEELRKHNVNESLWSDLQDRSSGDIVRKEDVSLTDDELKELDQYITDYGNEVVLGWGRGSDACNLDEFIDYLKTDRKVDDRILKYVKDNWFDEICDGVDASIEQTQEEWHQDMNESLWSDLEDRSSGDTIRKEDDVNLLDLNEFYKYIKDRYKTKVEYIDLDAMGDENGDVLGVDITEDIILFYKPKRGHILLSWSRVKIPMPFFDELTDRFKVENPNAMRRIVTEKDGSCTNKTFVDVIEFFLGHKDGLVNESLWSDLQDRSSGDTIRKEDDVLTDQEINSLNQFTLMYCREERAHYIQHHIVPPPPSGRKENDYEGLIKYIEDRRDENRFTNVGDYNNIIRFIKKNWDKLNMDKYIKKYIFSPTVMKGKKIVECEGVPGGLTPADVGGMGEISFPGPDGTPGSGDIPMLTGVVYHQVAPFGLFIKDLKKKKKKKKFRIEDEPCAHSKNPKKYDYVDDFREYVDRTYNNIDRRK